MQTNLAVFFGGRSVEHEVSVISAVQAMGQINRDAYRVLPIYIKKSGELVTGDVLFDIENYRDLPALLRQTRPASLVRRGDRTFLRVASRGRFSKDEETPIDLAFPIVHGTNCEDGTLQGYLEFLGLPYIGCDVAASAVGMDKAVFKAVMQQAGLPVLPCVTLRARAYFADREAAQKRLADEVGFPMVVKPVNLGSSVGITKVSDPQALDDAASLAFSFSDRILAEPAVSALREINCAVLGDADGCEASVCEEPLNADEILSYENKYLGGGKSGKAGQGSKGMASLDRKIPADLPKQTSEEIRALACAVFRAIGASGVARIDFLLDTRENRVYVNEINTIPGSLAFYLWEASGLSYPALIDRLADLAFRRQRVRETTLFAIETNLLSNASGFGAKGAKGSKRA